MRLKGETKVRSKYERWLEVYEEIIGHTGVMMIVLVSFWVLEAVFNWLWGREKLLFDFLPFKWAIDAADLFAFGALSYAGIMSSIRAYRGEQ